MNTYKRALWQNYILNSHQQPLVSYNWASEWTHLLKGENWNVEMPAKERIQTRIVAASAVKKVLDFRFAPQLTWCSDKKKHPSATMQQSSLITEMWQNIPGENLRLLNFKMFSIFGST